MNRYQELERKADSLRSAALQCILADSRKMADIWRQKEAELRALARELLVQDHD